MSDDSPTPELNEEIRRAAQAWQAEHYSRFGPERTPDILVFVRAIVDDDARKVVRAAKVTSRKWKIAYAAQRRLSRQIGPECTPPACVFFEALRTQDETLISQAVSDLERQRREVQPPG